VKIQEGEYNPIPQPSPTGTSGIVNIPTPKQDRIAKEKQIDYSIEGRLNAIKKKRFVRIG